MKSLFYYLCALLFMMTSCMERDLYQDPTIDPGTDPTVPTQEDFTGQTKEDATLTVTAIDGNGDYVAGTKFYFYAENPYDEDGNWTEPSLLFYGVTGANGVLEASFTLPNGLKTVYVQGYGFLQTYDVETGDKSLLFQSPKFEYLPTTKSMLRSDEEDYPSIPVHPQPTAGEFQNVYTFYDGARGIYEGAPAYTYKGHVGIEEDTLSTPKEGVSLSTTGAPLIGYGNGLVTQNERGSELKSKAELRFPEKGLGFKTENKHLLEASHNTDLVVTDANGAEVWATYLGDGGFCVNNSGISYNMLCYYHYTEGETLDAKKIRKTVLFPNTDPNSTPCGTQVQLLYWNGSKYVKTFPKGTKIGWCYIQNGFGKRGNAADSPNRFSEPRISGIKYYRFSTASLNGASRKANGLSSSPTYNQAVAFWNEETKCTFVGIENRWVLTEKDGKQDNDFNDVLIAVTSNPVIKPGSDISGELPSDEEDNKEIKSEQLGTLAFEDMHPQKGDYDHNDVVIDYTYRIVKDQSAQVTAVEAEFIPRAAGGMRKSGFGIEFPQIDLSNAKGDLESGCTTPVVIVYDDVHGCFGEGLSGLINTYTKLAHYESPAATTVRVELNSPLSVDESNKFTVLKFNPFIFVDQRGNETHLIDYKPTSKNTKQFGVQDDKSDGVKTFYRSNDGFAWVLDITRISTDESSWTYPAEGTSVVDAYPGYSDWAKDNHFNTNIWFTQDKGNAELLYIPAVKEPEDNKEEGK
ncbi:MAG: LruC domain-containing protein [Parabacteroides sp.]|nr:LruC domain-containing protein [Parabacteroides sp.]